MISQTAAHVGIQLLGHVYMNVTGIDSGSWIDSPVTYNWCQFDIPGSLFWQSLHMRVTWSEVCGTDIAREQGSYQRGVVDEDLNVEKRWATEPDLSEWCIAIIVMLTVITCVASKPGALARQHYVWEDQGTYAERRLFVYIRAIAVSMLLPIMCCRFAEFTGSHR